MSKGVVEGGGGQGAVGEAGAQVWPLVSVVRGAWPSTTLLGAQV